MSGLEKVSYLGLRGRIYEQLYNSNSQDLDVGALSLLETALVSLYKAILAFLALAMKRLGKSHPARAITALFDPKVVNDRLEQMDNCATEADREASNCGRWITMTGRKHFHDLMDKRFISAEAILDSLYLKLTAQEHTKALRWVSPVTYASDHEAAREGRVSGTGDWLLQRSELQQWYRVERSSLFWLHGIRELKDNLFHL